MINKSLLIWIICSLRSSSAAKQANLANERIVFFRATNSVSFWANDVSVWAAFNKLPLNTACTQAKLGWSPKKRDRSDWLRLKRSNRSPRLFCCKCQFMANWEKSCSLNLSMYSSNRVWFDVRSQINTNVWKSKYFSASFMAKSYWSSSTIGNKKYYTSNYALW